MTVVLLLLAILALLLLRVPVAYAFLGPGAVYLVLTGQSVGLAMRLIAEDTASFPLLAVPLFVLLGALATHAGIADRLFDFALALAGRVRGGLGYVSIGVSLGFAWMSGSAVTDAAASEQGPDPRHGAQRLLHALRPRRRRVLRPHRPGDAASIPAVIFAGLAAISTGALFAASVVPALLMATGLAVVVFVLVRRQPDIVKVGFSWERVRTHRRPGDRTPRRAGDHPRRHPRRHLHPDRGRGGRRPLHAGCSGFAYREAGGSRDLPGIFAEAVMTTAAIMLIVASAALLGYVFARERIPQDLASLILDLTDNGTVFLVLVALLMLLLGTVVDAVAILVLTVPMLMPIAVRLDVDPLVLGVLMIISLMIGLLTPPVGTVLYVHELDHACPRGRGLQGARCPSSRPCSWSASS